MKTLKSTNHQPKAYGANVLLWILIFVFPMHIIRVDAQGIRVKKGNSPTITLQQKVQQIYTSQIGVREKPSNSGPEVEQYLRYVNLPKGNPWCAAFVCWVLGKAGVGNPRSGWTPLLFPDSRVIWEKDQGTRIKEQRLPETAKKDQGTRIKEPRDVSSSKYQESSHPQNALGAYPSSQVTGNRQQKTPRSADIFGLYFPEKGRIAHVGFIDQWDGTWMITVEGNTNDSGSREGDGVYRKRRLVRSVYKVARYIH